MPVYLKQSTASQEVPLGHFVDDTDGKTAETALTIANTDIKVWKAGATTLASKNSGGATHISGGIYYAVLDATDTDTLGSLVLFVAVAGALAVRLECVVLAANIFDSMIGGGDVLDVSVTQWLGTAVSTPTVAGVPNVNAKTWNDLATVALPLVPTTAGRTLDVSAGGEAGVDWANVGTPGSTVALSATTVATLTNAPADSAGVTTLLSRLTSARAGYLDALSTGVALSAAGIQAVWDALTSALTTVGSVGKLLVDNLNATVSSRLATAGYTAPDNSSITAIKAKTDNLPSDPADASDIAASFVTVNATLATMAGYIDTEVAAIKAKTDNLPASPAAAGDAMALTTAERNSVADALLNRDMATGTDSGSPTVRTPRQALRLLRDKWTVSGGTLTVYKEDDSTPSWTATVGTTAGADPVTSNDPA